MMKKKNAVATTPGRGLPANASTTDLMVRDAASGKSGFENFGADDIAIPFISILQALSPQVRGAAKLKNAAEGDFFNTVTNQVIKDKLLLVPCAYEKAYVEWVLREKGGGFVRKHSDASILDRCKRDEKNRDLLPNGNIVVTTAYHYCLMMKEKGTFERVVVSFTSTQLKKSRRWNSQMLSLQISAGGKTFNPPMYSHTYEASTIEESNDQGTWAGWVIENPAVIENPDIYLAAKKFHDDVTRGAVKTAPPPDETAGTASSAASAEPEAF